MASRVLISCVVLTVVFVLTSSAVFSAEPFLEQTNISHIRGIQTNRIGGQVFVATANTVEKLSVFVTAIDGKWSENDYFMIEIFPITLRTTLSGELRVYEVGKSPVGSAKLKVVPDLYELAKDFDKTTAQDGVWIDIPISAKLEAGKTYAILYRLEPREGEFRSLGLGIVVGSRAVYADGMYVESQDNGATWQVHLDWDQAFKLYSER